MIHQIVQSHQIVLILIIVIHPTLIHYLIIMVILKKKKQEKGRINKKFTQNGGNRKIKLNTNINQIILKRIINKN